MTLLRRNAAIRTLLVAFLGFVPLLQAAAVEMRTSCGPRDVVRTVSATPAMFAGAPAIAEFQPEMAMGMAMAESPMVGGCYPTAPCLPMLRGMWVDLDFLVWWRSGRDFPVLASEGANGINPPFFGGQSIDERPRPGGRLEVGLWLDPCQTFGVEGHYLSISDAPVDWFKAADGANGEWLGRPFFNPNVALVPGNRFNDSLLMASPVSDSNGTLRIRSSSEFQAADLGLRRAIARCGGMDVDLLVGYQYARVDEDLLIESVSNQVAQPLTRIAVSDLIDTQNEYHAAHFGVEGEYRFGQFGFELLARCGFGNMRQQVTLAGETAIASPPTAAPVKTATGLFAQASNSGLHSQDAFSYMQDAGVTLNYYPLERLKLSLGYNLMFFSSIVRPGEHIALEIPQPPRAGQPAFVFDTDTFAAHGLAFGMEYDF